MAGSSRGRTLVSKTSCGGSIPSPAATLCWVSHGVSNGSHDPEENAKMVNAAGHMLAVDQGSNPTPGANYRGIALYR